MGRSCSSAHRAVGVLAPQTCRSRRGVHGGNLHNLHSWFALLNDARFFRGNPWGAVVAATIERRVLIVVSHWRESSRYTSLAATNAELEEALVSVDWLLGNYDALWR